MKKFRNLLLFIPFLLITIISSGCHKEHPYRRYGGITPTDGGGIV